MKKKSNINSDDWINTAGNRLVNKTFIFQKYKPVEKNNDHDHCEFCFKKFYKESIDDFCTTEGFVTQNDIGQGIWVCKDCFDEYKNTFDLKVK